VVIEAGTTGPLRIRNPWSGHAVEVVSRGGKKIQRGTEITLQAAAGEKYLLRNADASPLPFAAVTGEPASNAKTLGAVHIGLGPR
jgi:hypothetical protein